jgi:hypothetical protein
MEQKKLDEPTEQPKQIEIPYKTLKKSLGVKYVIKRLKIRNRELEKRIEFIEEIPKINEQIIERKKSIKQEEMNKERTKKENSFYERSPKFYYFLNFLFFVGFLFLGMSFFAFEKKFTPSDIEYCYENCGAKDFQFREGLLGVIYFVACWTIGLFLIIGSCLKYEKEINK